MCEASYAVLGGVYYCELPCAFRVDLTLDVSLCTGIKCDRPEFLLVMCNGCLRVQLPGPPFVRRVSLQVVQVPLFHAIS